MRRIIVFVLAFLLSPFYVLASHPPYAEGAILNVFAQSGLKLRSAPGLHSEVIDIVRYGDKVEVVNTFDYCEDNADRIEWLDGHWILVNYEGIAGYLFDAYLSKLPFPSSEEEIYQDGFSFAYILNRYFDSHFALQDMLDSSEQRKTYLLADGIKVKSIDQESTWKIELEIPSYDIPELINLMRSMLSTREQLAAFDHSLIFIEGPDEIVSEVRINLSDNLSIKKKQNGNILVKASGYSGC